MVKKTVNNQVRPAHFFCENLKFLLKKFGLNQTELAVFIERQQTTVSNWVNGVTLPDVDDLVKIYYFFGFGIEAMIFTDLSKSSLITDKYIARVKAKQKNEEEPERNLLEEPAETFNKSVIDMLGTIETKLDGLHTMTKKLVPPGKKAK